MDHTEFMNEAIKEAEIGYAEGGIPIGSVLVKDGVIIGRGHNQRAQKNSAILHAEMDCLENAGRLTAEEYAQCTIYSTLSPCDMCTGAILLYKIPRVVIGENESFKGPEEYSQSKGVELINLDLEACKQLMRRMMAEKPALWAEDIGVEE
jgi:cytosine/creatinine deaminase